MTTNVFDVSDEIVIMGTCLPSMQPKAYQELLSICPNIYQFCLEKEHINMALSKVAGMVARNNIKHIIFATLDKSLHCIQLHYLAHELLKITDKKGIKTTHYIAANDQLNEVSAETVALSRNLLALNNAVNK